MNNDILSSLRPALVMALLFALLLGLGYPLAMTGIGQLLFPDQAVGCLDAGCAADFLVLGADPLLADDAIHQVAVRVLGGRVLEID